MAKLWGGRFTKGTIALVHERLNQNPKAREIRIKYATSYALPSFKIDLIVLIVHIQLGFSQSYTCKNLFGIQSKV